MAVREIADIVKSNVSIQSYFDTVIIPSMKSYYDGETVDFELRPTCCCPLHNEDTPSFRYYEYSNTYYCFGCGSGGDVIQLHREFMRINNSQNVSFDAAVSFLYKTFVECRKVTGKLGIKKHNDNPEVQESSNIELMRYGSFRKQFEDDLLVNKKISKGRKIELYNKLDQIDSLLQLQLLNASTALDIIKEMKMKANTVKIRP